MERSSTCDVFMAGFGYAQALVELGN
jgi:hypothetical protein